MNPWDAVVVGGGPAGLSAAIWLGRYRRRTLVIDSGEYRNRWIDTFHGYYGADGDDPAAVRDRARRDLSKYPAVEIAEEKVTGVQREDDLFDVTAGSAPIKTRRIVLATGVRDVFPEVENFFDYYGKSVFHCPTCDGYEAQNKHVVVFGWNEAVAAFARHLLEWASSVTIVTNGASYEGPSVPEGEIELREDNAKALVGTGGVLSAVVLGSGEQIDAQMAFFTIDNKPMNEFATALGCRLTDEGCIEVDEQGATSVEGVFAAGDVVPGPHVVQIAAAKGAMAGIACAVSLR